MPAGVLRTLSPRSSRRQATRDVRELEDGPGRRRLPAGAFMLTYSARVIPPGHSKAVYLEPLINGTPPTYAPSLCTSVGSQ